MWDTSIVYTHSRLISRKLLMWAYREVCRGFVQRMVSRLSDPYGDCRDPYDVDKMTNAYSEHFPVVYTAQVSI